MGIVIYPDRWHKKNVPAVVMNILEPPLTARDFEAYAYTAVSYLQEYGRAQVASIFTHHISQRIYSSCPTEREIPKHIFNKKVAVVVDIILMQADEIHKSIAESNFELRH